ncbi:MAG: hypothetical protein IKM66_05845 [Clostridia bacterium]|nr:hypothetical protein [Clostridia bacterium]
MTERLFEKDAYCRNFSADVLSCEEKDSFYYIVLDKTAFFPEGGGQAPDKGTINGESVLDVQEKDGIIYHKTEKAFETGEKVQCELDWDLRFSRMQSHAGEHIVSGVVHSLFGYDNVGFHMSEKTMTVDFSGPLTVEDIAKVELESNKAIYKNAPITASYPTKEELVETDYRSKIEPRDGIRLITIEGIDCCACCAPHPAFTGEIGVIKIIDFCPHKKGTRIEMVAGINAFLDYTALHTSVKSVMNLLSAKRDSISLSVEKLQETANNLKSENGKMSRKLALASLNPITVNGCAYAISENMSYDDLRECANNLIQNGTRKCILLSETEDSNYIYVVSSAENDVRTIVNILNSTFNGKGGGKDNYAQGKLSASSDKEFTSIVEEILINN